MYLKNTPRIAKIFFPDCLWKGDKNANVVYLTFDDGPDPEVTSWVLEELKSWKAKATFFVNGVNAEKYPELIKTILQNENSIGNHTYSHLDAFSSKADAYLENVKKGADTIEVVTGEKVKLFRPPYGRLTLKLYRKLREEFKIVMWSQMPGDFDEKKTGREVLDNCLKHLKPGSIIVLHDSQKAKESLKVVLPGLLKALKEKGWVTGVIDWK